MPLFNYTREEVARALRKMWGLRGDLGSRVETVLQPVVNVGSLTPPFHWYPGFAGGAVSGPAVGMVSHIGVSNTAPMLLVIDYILVGTQTATRVRLTNQGNGIPPSDWGPFANHNGTWDANAIGVNPIVQFGGAAAAAAINPGATLAEVETQAGGMTMIPGPFNLDPGGAQFSPNGSADFGQTLFLYSVTTNVRMCATFYGRFFDPTDMGIGR